MNICVTTLVLLVVAGDCVSDRPSVSQISPKSSIYFEKDVAQETSISSIMLESTVSNNVPLILPYEENETNEHIRVERSAVPILNENFPKSGPNELHFDNNHHKETGRYFQYNIKPTGTFDGILESGEITQSSRLPKSLNSAETANIRTGFSEENYFLLKGDLRPPTSGSPITPTSSTAMQLTPTATVTALPNQGRQNPNPDIQDIITGIVKLLNGNVNVHANTQAQRRPTASRINNRGPPRISEVQSLPIDYDHQKPPMGSSIRPPLYPFDRPERPFITGVPIPEQVVPHRPGFVSSRPPWHRNRPRLPITAGSGARIPFPQYKPLPTQHQQFHDLEQLHEQKQQSISRLPATTTQPYETELQSPDVPLTPDHNKTLNSLVPTDDTYDLELPNQYDLHNTEQNLSSEEIGTVVEGLKDTSPKNSNHIKKNKTTSESEKGGSQHQHTSFSTEDYTTIIEPSLVVNSTQVMSSTYFSEHIPAGVDVDVDFSTEDIIFMASSRTPSLELISSDPQKEIQNPTTISVKPLKDKDSITIQISKHTPVPSTPSSTISSSTIKSYHPRPGIVLDDPEFKPGGHSRPRPQTQPPVQRPPQVQVQIQPTRQKLPPGYGEIFDVTLSAIQGPGSGGGSSQQTINIKPYGSQSSVGNGNNDIILSPSGDDGFVSIDGKRTYINLFGDPTDEPSEVPTTKPVTKTPQIFTTQSKSQQREGYFPSSSGAVGTGYAVPEAEEVDIKTGNTGEYTKTTAINKQGLQRPPYRPRTTQLPVRIDTCIVGDDSTCDQAQHEHCKTENGVSSCHCRPGYSRRKHREPCRKVISFFLSLRVDRIYEHRIVWDKKLLDRYSDPFGQLSYESIRAIDSAMSMTPYSDEFMEAKVNNIYRGEANQGSSAVFVNLTIKLDESVETLRPNLRSDVQKHLLGVMHRRNNNIGNSILYVTSPEGSVSHLEDLDECRLKELNDCHTNAVCSNSWGSFRCICEIGFRDPWVHQPFRAGRECQSCPDTYCNNRGVCKYNDDGTQVCTCNSSYYGGQCEIDGEVLGVAIGASVAAVIIIVLTLVCLIMWSRRWQREQKHAMGSPVFGYINTAPLKSAGMPQPGYQVTLEDRMRWAQIADVMAQTNHYGAEPIAPTRPSSAMFVYPNLQPMGIGTMGGMSMQSTMQMHQNGALPPVPLPRRLGLSPRSNGMRTLENSSSSEEEDQTDLLGRNFQVPRPKSRSNGSIANQSGIYYDVDYEPSGGDAGSSSVDMLYGSQNQQMTHSNASNHHHHIPGHQGIPMSTYASGRAPSSYYMK